MRASASSRGVVDTGYDGLPRTAGERTLLSLLEWHADLVRERIDGATGY